MSENGSNIVVAVGGGVSIVCVALPSLIVDCTQRLGALPRGAVRVVRPNLSVGTGSVVIPYVPVLGTAVQKYDRKNTHTVAKQTSNMATLTNARAWRVHLASLSLHFCMFCLTSDLLVVKHIYTSIFCVFPAIFTPTFTRKVQGYTK